MTAGPCSQQRGRPPGEPHAGRSVARPAPPTPSCQGLLGGALEQEVSLGRAPSRPPECKASCSCTEPPRLGSGIRMHRYPGPAHGRSTDCTTPGRCGLRRTAAEALSGWSAGLELGLGREAGSGWAGQGPLSRLWGKRGQGTRRLPPQGLLPGGGTTRPSASSGRGALGLCGHLTGQCWIFWLDSNTVW